MYVSTILSYTNGEDISDKIDNIGLGGMDTMAGFLDAITLDAFKIKDFVSISGQRVRNPHIEFMFIGTDPRNFTFNFKFLPKNQHEVNLVTNIIHSFKFHSAPEIIGDDKAGAYYHYPSTFDISFFGNGKENKRINKISTCVLTNINVKYNGSEGVWTTFKKDSVGSMPVSATLSLDFTETELITKEKIMKGY